MSSHRWLAAFHLTDTRSLDSASPDRDLPEHLSRCFSKLPESRRSLSEFCQLHNRIAFLIGDYAARAMDTKGIGFPTAPNLPLSSTQKARFQRAFYRYNCSVYCSLLLTGAIVRITPLLLQKSSFAGFLSTSNPGKSRR